MAGAVSILRGGLQASIAQDGYAFVRGKAMQQLIAPFGSTADWDAFAASWNRLELDTYMADGGRYRRRRHAVFAARRDALVRKPHQPHFQTLNYNPLHGGIERWFEPIEPGVAGGPTLTAVLA